MEEYCIGTLPDGPRVGYFVTDNATNNDTAIDIVLLHFLPYLQIKQRRARRLRCLGHVINLAAKAFLYGTEYEAFQRDIDTVKENSELLKELKLWRKRGPVGKLHNVVIFICRSPQRRQKFASIGTSQPFAFDELKLVVDNATRWNSLYSIIERALLVRERIDSFCIAEAESMHGSSIKKATTNDKRDSLLSNDTLTNDDWLALSEIKEILYKFYILTKRAEGSSMNSDRGVLADYMVTMNTLLEHVRLLRDRFEYEVTVEELNTPSKQYLRTCTVNCWTKLDSYFAKANETPALYAAIVTQPSSKWVYFEHTWKNVATWRDARSPQTWLPNSRKALQKLWDEEYKPLLLGEADNISEIRCKRPRENTPDEFDRALNMVALYGEEAQYDDDLEAWLAARVFALSRQETLPQYWLRQLGNRKTYRLAMLALDMASIPAMSSDCERVFSQAKLLITGQRNNLKVDIIEATQCLRMWIIMGQQAKGSWSGKGNWATPGELFNHGEVPEVVVEPIVVD